MIICTVIGVRPQFIKAAMLSPIIRKEHTEILIHTGQHYDENMSEVFFRELGLPKQDYRLTVSGGTDKEKIDNMVRQLIPVLKGEKADAVLIYGDTNSTLAGALAAAELNIPVIHVEAGERNGLVNNPEEKIRMQVDQISSLLLCCSSQAIENLRKEGLWDRAHYIGNLMEVSFSKNIARPRVLWLQNLAYPAWQRIPVPPKYYLLTCHRQENANETNLTEILLAMEKANAPVIFPVHPRNKERALKIYREHNLQNVFLTDPAGYLDSIHLIKNAVAVITDSGGVLQEAHFAQTPYVFVLDIPRPPKDTRFDVSRLVKADRRAILEKLTQPQKFSDDGVGRVADKNLAAGTGPAADKVSDADKVKHVKTTDWDLQKFEENLLMVLREFDRKLKKELENDMSEDHNE